MHHYFEPRPRDLVPIQGPGGRDQPIDVEAEQGSPLEENTSTSPPGLETSEQPGDKGASGKPGPFKSGESGSTEAPPFSEFLKWKESRKKGSEAGQKPEQKPESKRKPAQVPFKVIIPDDFYPEDEALLAIKGVDSSEVRGLLSSWKGLPGFKRLPTTLGRGEATSGSGGCFLGGGAGTLTRVPFNWSLHDLKLGPHPDSELYLAAAAEGLGGSGRSEPIEPQLAMVCKQHLICLLRAFLIYGSATDFERFQRGLPRIRHQSYGRRL